MVFENVVPRTWTQPLGWLYGDQSAIPQKSAAVSQVAKEVENLGHTAGHVPFLDLQ